MSEATAALTGDNGSTDTGASADTTSTENTASWTEGFDEDTLAYTQNKGWDSPTKMIESYRNLEKFAGGSKSLVELPGEDADEEALSNFYGKLGRPDAPDNYSFQAPDGADTELDGWFRQTAHKHGLSDKQAAALYNDWNEMSVSRLESLQTSMREQAETDIKGLKKEWGGEYDNMIDAGKRAVNALGYDQDSLSVLEEKMGTAEMLKLFATVGSKMGEDSFEDGSSGERGFGMTPAQARNEIQDLKLDKNFMDKYLAGDRDAVAKMTRLNKAAFGG